MMRKVIRTAGRAAMMAAILGTAVPVLAPEGMGLDLARPLGLVAAANPFAPAITVNGLVITQFELEQRARFLQILGQPGDSAKLAEEQLIADRLRQQAAKALGVTASRDELAAGMASFAAQGNLSTDAFLAKLGEAGVQPQTLRDFIQAGLLWRGVMRQKFGGRIHISEAEVDRAIANGAASGGGLRLEVSEIVLPNDGKMDVDMVAQRIYDRVKSPADFAAQAALNSKVASARNGGALGWMDEKSLPPNVAAALAALKPGEMTKPIRQEAGTVMYLLQGRSEGPGPNKGAMMVDYAVLQPAVGSDPVRIAAGLTNCDQLNTLARGLDPLALQRQTQAEASLPADLRGVVAGLDAGEASVVAGASGTARLVMLCSRAPRSQVEISREDVRAGLVDQRVGLLSNAYMEELRSEALITRQ